MASNALSYLAVLVSILEFLRFQIGPTHTVRVLEIFQLVRESVKVFGKKLPLDERKALATLGRASSNQRCHNGTISVKFARLSLPLNPSAATWIRKAEAASAGLENETSDFYLDERYVFKIKLRSSYVT